MWNFEGRGRWAVTQKPKLIQHYVWHTFMLFSIELDFNLKNSILQRTPNSLPSASNLLTYFWRRVYSLTVFLVKWGFQRRLRECLSKKSSKDFWNKTQHQYSVGLDCQLVIAFIDYYDLWPVFVSLPRRRSDLGVRHAWRTPANGKRLRGKLCLYIQLLTSPWSL